MMPSSGYDLTHKLRGRLSINSVPRETIHDPVFA